MEPDQGGENSSPTAHYTIRSPTPEGPQTDEPRPRKRRSRAQVACRLCRARKTRCDNRRPTCGYCSFQGVKCDYPDSSTPDLTADASNHVILERVNYAVGLLEEIRHDRDAQKQVEAATAVPTQQTRYHAFQPIAPSQGPDYRESAGLEITRTNSIFTDDGFGQLEISEAAAQTSACESLLRWPVLDGLNQDASVVSLGLETTFSEKSRMRQQGLIQQDHILPLCRKFLALIHFKNPILDVSEFMQFARSAAEYGPGWDEDGCLVLLACALACVAAPYNQDRATERQSRLSLEESTGAQEDVDINMAEFFFRSAQRRLGLLTPSLIAVQCQYLAGLYEKFLVRPLAAWSLLQGASAQLQAYLYAKGLSAGREGCQEGKRERHIEQRLYWSCVKAECELRIDLQLPSSGLPRFKYPGLFPSLSLPSTSALQPLSPPEESGTPPLGQTTWSPAAWQGSPDTTAGGGFPVNQDRALQPEEERSWLHYLAEISLRSIMNRVLAGLYAGSESQWMSATNPLLIRQEALLEELKSWHTHLPPQLAFSSPITETPGGPIHPPSNELSFFLMTRYVGVLEWIHRPFLYVALHASDGIPVSPLVWPLAQMAVDASAALIRLVAAQHRHGGIWGLVRRSFGAAAALIATARWAGRHGRTAPHSRLALPGDWPDLVRLSLRTIQAWAREETSDLKRMHRILEGIFRGVNSLGINSN